MAHSRTQWAHSRTQCRSSRGGSGSDTYVAVLLCSRCDRRSSPTVRSQPHSRTWDATPTSPTCARTGCAREAHREPDGRGRHVRTRVDLRAWVRGTPAWNLWTLTRMHLPGTRTAGLTPMGLDAPSGEITGGRLARAADRGLGAGFWGGVRTMVRMSQDRHLWDSSPRGETPSA